METSKDTENHSLFKTSVKVRTRVVLCVLILLLGLLGMFGLSSLKKPPGEVAPVETPLSVEAVEVAYEDVPVSITGYGEVRSLNVVSLAPEVAGKVVDIHPRLELGEIIPGGDLLFRIDPRDYEAAAKSARAVVRQWQGSIARLKKQFAIDRERLKTLERNRDLARAEFDRLRRLYQDDSVGTRSGVDAAERSANQAADAADQLGQAVLLYPIRIREAESSLAAAEANRITAEVNLERCEVRAPFRGRVKAVSLEKGQYVAPGQTVLTLADDSVLEILVPLDSRDARKWLRFDKELGREGTAWFRGLEPVQCEVRWTEDREEHVWSGRLHRVVKFDQQTRTLTVAIRIDAGGALSNDPKSLPLVEGMFCSVTIPGRTLEKVIRLPRWAVSFENTVYTSRENRLKTLPVKVDRIEGEEAFVSQGLHPGDIVVTTRLIDPLENTLLDVKLERSEENAS